MMSHRDLIAQVFGPGACGNALFYDGPGGLRFEMSEGGAPLDQVLTALRKATEILEFVFCGREVILICLRRHMGTGPFSLRRPLRELALAGIPIPEQREIWVESVPLDERWDENVEEWNAFVAFEFPMARLQSLLWCAFATDFGSFRPNPQCSFYLMDIERCLLAHPYDDRGMDLIGENHELLSQVYFRFNSMLLDHDRATMDKTFKLDHTLFQRTLEGAIEN
jgi:hypothetical protein